MWPYELLFVRSELYSESMYVYGHTYNIMLCKYHAHIICVYVYSTFIPHTFVH